MDEFTRKIINLLQDAEDHLVNLNQDEWRKWGREANDRLIALIKFIEEKQQ